MSVSIPQRAAPVTKRLPRIRVNRAGSRVFEQVMSKRSEFNIGHRMNTDFNLPPETRIGKFKLFQWKGEQLMVTLHEDFNGWIYVEGRRQYVSELLDGKKKRIVACDPDSYGTVGIDEFEFSFELVPESIYPQQKQSLSEQLKALDWTFFFFIAPVMLAQIVMSIYLSTQELPKKEKQPSYEITRNKVTQLMFKKPKEAPPPPPPKLTQAAKQEGDGPKKEAPPQKKKSAPPPPQRAAKPTKEPPATPPAAAQQAKSMQKVRNSGLLALIGAKSGNGAVSQLLSGSNLNGIGAALNKVTGNTNLNAALGQMSAKLKSGDVKHVGIGSIDGVGSGREVGVGDQKDGAISIGEGDIASGSGGKGDGGGGGYDLNGAKKVIYRNIGALKMCYDKALKSNPGIAGSFVFEFTILQSGLPERDTMRILGAEGIPDLTQCVITRFSRLNFPKPKGFDVTIRYPINFKGAGP